MGMVSATARTEGCTISAVPQSSWLTWTSAACPECDRGEVTTRGSNGDVGIDMRVGLRVHLAVSRSSADGQPQDDGQLVTDPGYTRPDCSPGP